MGKVEVEVSREQFYEEVWSEPPYRVSMKYGLAEIGIRRFAASVEEKRVVMDPEMSIQRWVQWARSEADRIDPIKEQSER